MADNFHFDLTGVDLERCLAIAFAGAPGAKAVAWAEMDADPEGQGPESLWGASQGTRRLVLFWHADTNSVPAARPDGPRSDSRSRQSMAGCRRLPTPAPTTSFSTARSYTAGSPGTSETPCANPGGSSATHSPPAPGAEPPASPASAKLNG